MRHKQCGVVRSSGGVGVLDMASLGRMAERLGVGVDELKREYGVVEVKLGEGRLGVDRAEAVHSNGLVYPCAVIGVYPEMFDRFLGEAEMTIDDFVSARFGEGRITGEQWRRASTAYADYVLRRSSRPNRDLDAIFGVEERRGENGEVLHEQA